MILDASMSGLSADQRQIEFKRNVALIVSHGIKLVNWLFFLNF